MGLAFSCGFLSLTLPLILGLYVVSDPLIVHLLDLEQQSYSVWFGQFSSLALGWMVGLYIGFVRLTTLPHGSAGIPWFCAGSLGLLVLFALRVF